VVVAVERRARVDAGHSVDIHVHVRHVVEIDVAIDGHVAGTRDVYNSLIARIVAPLHGDRDFDFR
jgi:hypothetical protein